MTLKKWIKVPLFVALFPDYIAYFKKWEKLSLFFYNNRCWIHVADAFWRTKLEWAILSHANVVLWECVMTALAASDLCASWCCTGATWTNFGSAHTRRPIYGFLWARWSQLTISIGSTLSIGCGDFLYIFLNFLLSKLWVWSVSGFNHLNFLTFMDNKYQNN